MAFLVMGCVAGGSLGLGLAALGVAVTTQGGQIFRVQRKSTGTAAMDSSHLLCLTTSAMAHPLASFAVLPNATTAAFVLAWRFVSISGHAVRRNALHCHPFHPPRLLCRLELARPHAWINRRLYPCLYHAARAPARWRF